MSATWHPLGPVDGFAAVELRGVHVGGASLCIARIGEQFFALDDTCPHAGGSLSEGMLDGREVICPLHAFAFTVDSGDCPDDPGCSARTHPTRVVAGTLEVKLP